MGKGHNFEAGDLQPSVKKANYETGMKERWNSIGGKKMKNRWFRIVVCLGAVMFILVLGVHGAHSKNYITSETYNKDDYYENYYEDSSKEETYYKDYYSKYSYYKGSYYNDYYKVYRYRDYKYVIFSYLKNLLERFPLLEKILANSLCLH